MNKNVKIAKELVRLAKSLVASRSTEEILREACKKLLAKYGNSLDINMGWDQDIFNDVIYLNYVCDNDDCDVLFNISFDYGEFCSVAIDADGTEVTDYKTYSNMDDLVKHLGDEFSDIDEYLEKQRQNDGDDE